MKSVKRTKRAFTLVELLVVIGVIGILVAVLLPALSSVQNTAKSAKTEATLVAIAAGLETYRQDTGDEYPPSRSDADSSGDFFKCRIPDPADANSTQEVEVTGANLLTWALVGQDLLGTAEFRDLNGDGTWWDDTDAQPGGSGLYSLSNDPEARPLKRRRQAYIDTSRVKVATMDDYHIDNLYPRNNSAASVPTVSQPTNLYLGHRVLLDGWNYPILYYKARTGANLMVTDEDSGGVDTYGVYAQADNAMYTGGTHFNAPAPDALDLGAGNGHRLFSAQLQGLEVSSSPQTTDLDARDAGGTLIFDGTFARYIWDQNVTARNVPARSDSYILASPGPDALWGTQDDVTNFKTNE